MLKVPFLQSVDCSFHWLLLSSAALRCIPLLVPSCDLLVFLFQAFPLFMPAASFSLVICTLRLKQKTPYISIHLGLEAIIWWKIFEKFNKRYHSQRKRTIFKINSRICVRYQHDTFVWSTGSVRGIINLNYVFSCMNRLFWARTVSTRNKTLSNAMAKSSTSERGSICVNHSYLVDGSVPLLMLKPSLFSCSSYSELFIHPEWIFCA